MEVSPFQCGVFVSFLYTHLYTQLYTQLRFCTLLRIFPRADRTGFKQTDKHPDNYQQGANKGPIIACLKSKRNERGNLPHRDVTTGNNSPETPLCSTVAPNEQPNTDRVFYKTTFI